MQRGFLSSVLGFGFFLGFACGFSLRGQVTVEVAYDQDQFLRDESLPLSVRVTNRSGQTLSLGADNSWLVFTVENVEGSVVTKLGEVPVEGPFTIKSSQTAHRLVDLMPYYELKPGRYRIAATVKIREWAQEVVSPPARIEIVNGTTIWEQVVGVPDPDGGPPTARKYMLQQARYLKDLVLYLRVSNEAETQVKRVVPLGKLLSFSRPEAQVDATSQLHLLFQDGPKSFNYSVMNSDGQLMRRERHDYAGSRPRLKPGKDGGIQVTGGVRRLSKTDFPMVSSDTVTNDVPKVAP